MSSPEQRLPKTFWWANMTQFGGALNDNLFKLFITFALIAWADPGERANVVVNVGLAFAVPFLIFVPIAGSFADHYSKRWIIVVLKAVELGIMCFGVYGLSSGNTVYLYVTMLLMSTQSAFFGPCKYGIIPELVGSERLSRANGAIQMFTYLAILTGTVTAPALSETFGEDYWKAGLICIVVSIAGFFTSLGIGPSPSYLRRPIRFNGLQNLVRSTKVIRRDGFLTLAVLATSFFTLIGAYMQLNLFEYGPEHLGLTSEQSARLFLITAVGIGLGSLLAGWLSGRVIEFGIVPIGTALMWISLVVIGLVPEGSIWTVCCCMLAIGIGAGFYVVPLESFIQYRSPKDKLGSVKAASSFLSWIGVLLGTGLMALFSTGLDLTAQTGFLIMSTLLLVLVVVSLWLLPDFFIKFVVMYLVRSWYRLRVYGLNNLPTERAALLVCNHVALIDALLVVSSQQRRIRMLMSRNVYLKANWLVRKLVDIGGVILVQDTDGPKQLVKSLRHARQALDEGFLVCIFAEGGLSLSGMMRPFKPGFERIIKGSDHPIIPVYIGGAWQSHSSWKRGIPRLHILGDLRYPVSVHFGRPLPSSATVPDVREAVCETGAETFEHMKKRRLSLGEEFVRTARRNWGRIAVIERDGTQHSYAQLLGAADQLRRSVFKHLSGQQRRVGVLLPDGLDNIIVHIGLSLERISSLVLDPEASPETHHERLRQNDIHTLITVPELIQGHSQEEIRDNLILIDEHLPEPGESSSMGDYVRLRYGPLGGVCNSKGYLPDEVATIQYTRGTTTPSRGVKLSHHNLLSNIESLRDVLRPEPEDTLMGVLRQGTVFAYSLNLWFPLLSGLKVVTCGSTCPLQEMATLAKTHRGSIIVATPEFLAACCREVEPDNFRHMRYVFTGGEKLPPATEAEFENTFGLVPLESYGATELSPVCTLSLPDIRINRFRETGQVRNMAGRPLPGIALRILDPETLLEQHPGEVGLIAVKGPNVMLGYIDGEPRFKCDSAEWFITGDHGHLDENGFLSITGRRKA